MARPGGNLTGMSIESTDLGGNGSNSCARTCRASAGWRSWNMSALPAPMRRSVKYNRGCDVLASKRSSCRYGPPTISRRSLIRSASAQKRLADQPDRECQPFRIDELALTERLPTMHGFGNCGSRRPDVVRAEFVGAVASSRRICRQDLARRKARRSADRAAEQVRIRGQPEGRPSDWPCGFADIACPRR